MSMRWIVVLVLVAGVYKGYQEFGSGAGAVEPLQEGAYVVVYGRDSCGYTQRMRNELAREGIDFRYARIDRQAVADRVHKRMRAAGIDTSRYSLPVVDVNGHIRTRPGPESVIERFEEGRS